MLKLLIQLVCLWSACFSIMLSVTETSLAATMQFTYLYSIRQSASPLMCILLSLNMGTLRELKKKKKAHKCCHMSQFVTTFSAFFNPSSGWFKNK